MEQLEKTSLELKEFLKKYDTAIILGHFADLIWMGGIGFAKDELARLSSPMRQLYYLGGLLVTSNPTGENKPNYTDEDWNYIVEHLNTIESEYYKLFLPKEGEEITEDWKKKREAAMPTFLSYFNQGPLNYEEQTINWISGVYSKLNDIINSSVGLVVDDFLRFYDHLDKWCEYNLQSLGGEKDRPLKDNWKDYAKVKIGIVEEAPEKLKEIGKEQEPLYTMLSDPGIKNRFKADDMTDESLPVEKVNKILDLLSCKRRNTNFLYYTENANPLYDFPIIDLGDGLYQVFEIKQVLHSIDLHLEKICSDTKEHKSKYVKSKGNYLEKRIAELFSSVLGKHVKIYTFYYVVDGCEQDILILWDNCAFIIEAKAYKINEPFRDPERAYKRIKQDFKRSVGYAYDQIWRVEEKFLRDEEIIIKDEKGNIVDKIDTKKYSGYAFPIIVTQKSFGQLQSDLSLLLELKEGSHYPWAVKFDDLEVFMLTLKARRKTPEDFIDFLLNREYLHGHVVCSDELEICGGYLTGDITPDMCESGNIITCTPSFANVFDDQYRKGMGFSHERHWKEKHSNKYLCL